MDGRFKTALLMGVMAGILLILGEFIGSRTSIGSKTGLIIAFIFALLLNFGMYFYSHKFVLWMYKAKEANTKDYKELHAAVEKAAKAAGIPKPKVYIVKSANPNAFATGPNPKNSVVAATTGILEILDKEELEGVMAHEISHIKNRDMLVATIAATIATVISFVAAIARYAAIFGDEDTNWLELIIIGILTPLLATLLQLAISRSREYMADASAARLLHNTKGLASALHKLETGAKHHPMTSGNKMTSSLFIVNPFKGNALLNLLSTHPAIDERIKRLNAMKV